jgi:glycosyltransferase involved in cell wall biosynthesis
MQEKVLQTYNLSSTVVAPGIDLKKYRPKKAKNYFLHVSRLDPEKGVLDLINAWDISTPLYLAGSGKEDYVSFLKEKAKGKKITFLGNVDPDSLRVYFAESLGVLLAAYNEPFGIVVIEGMASGKPVIALNKGGPADLIKPDFGFLVHNHGEMVSKASWIVSHQSKAAVMGKKAQKAVRAFDIEFYLSEIERLVLKD